MRYNLKVADYEGVLNVSYYETHITRNDETEKGESENDNTKKTAKSDQSDSKRYLQATWHNPATGKMEIVPEGFQVVPDPFTMIPHLEPFLEFMPEEFLSEEELFAYVAQKVKEDKAFQEFKNTRDSMMRAKKAIYEISKANKWDLFVTFTVGDQDKRYDLDEVKKLINKKIHKLRDKKNLHFGYLLIPELHKKGGWHFHGLFNNIGGLTLTKARSPYTNRLLKDEDGNQIYNVKEFESLGFNTATYVKDTVAVAKYITKYITKDMETRFPHKRKYLCSKGLNRATVLLEEVESLNDIPDLLERVVGYRPEKVYDKITLNPYTNTNIRYMEYKK